MIEWTPCIEILLLSPAVTTRADWRLSDGLITRWEAAVAITDDTYAAESSLELRIVSTGGVISEVMALWLKKKRGMTFSSSTK